MEYLLIGGPTGSGKSALAVDYARQYQGEIINADSLQVYRDLHILTARPSPETCAEIPHHLDGVLNLEEHATAAWWMNAAVSQILEIKKRGKLPIVVGGTGLYLKTLTHGIAHIPDIDPEIRTHVRTLCETSTKGAFFDYVRQVDSYVEDHLKPNDHQRLSRALEVFLQTKKSIFEWQKQQSPPLPFQPKIIILQPDRTELYARIDQRFQRMIIDGAAVEVQALMRKSPLPTSMIWKAIGVREIQSYLLGENTLEDVIMQAQQNSRRYAKRQLTWFRHQMSPS